MAGEVEQMTDKEYILCMGRISQLYKEIENLQQKIKDSDYDEPIHCLGCWWEGKKSELIDSRRWFHFGVMDFVCPACKSMSWQYVY